MGHSVEAAGWTAETDKLLDRMAARFARVETRRRAGRFVRALLADLPRKNCWSIAEHAGDADPHGMQHFLSRASWDTDGVRDDLRDYVSPRSATPTPCWWSTYADTATMPRMAMSGPWSVDGDGFLRRSRRGCLGIVAG